MMKTSTKFLSFLVLILFLAACGGGGSSSTVEVDESEDKGPLQCISDKDCDGIIDYCDANDDVAFDAATATSTPFSLECDRDQDSHKDADCTGVTDTLFCDMCIDAARKGTDPTKTCAQLGCAAQGGDSDNDGVCNSNDSCPNHYNPGSLQTADSDGDGDANACDSSDDTDSDGDGVTVSEGDCDDNDALVNPDSTQAEALGGTDYNCDGETGDVGNAIFVDGTRITVDATDPNIGSISNPYNLLSDAIGAARSSGKAVYVFQGSISVAGSITLNGTVNVSGGYYCVNDSDATVTNDHCRTTADVRRDPESHPTILTTTGNAETVKVTGGTPKLDGFVIRNKESSNYSALKITSASPTIINNTVELSPLSGANISAIKIEGSGTIAPVLDDIVIQLQEGSVPSTIYGINISTTSPSSILRPTIKNSVFNIANSTTAIYGIYIKRNAEYSQNNLDVNLPVIEANEFELAQSKKIYGIYQEKIGSVTTKNKIKFTGINCSDVTQCDNVGLYIYQSGSAKNYFYHNFVSYNLEEDGMQPASGVKIDASNIKVYNNTILVGGGNPSAGLRIANFSTKEVKIANNIFAIASGLEETGLAIYEEGDGTSQQGNYQLDELKNNFFDTDLYAFYDAPVYKESCDVDFVMETCDFDGDGVISTTAPTSTRSITFDGHTSGSVTTEQSCALWAGVVSALYNGACVFDRDQDSSLATLVAETRCNGGACTGNIEDSSLGLINDYQLLPSSRAKDNGIGFSGLFGFGNLDIDGNPRVNGTIDIGCYEYTPAP